MDAGAGGIGRISLIRKVRNSLEALDKARNGGPWWCAAVRRDIGGLVDRLEKLRLSYPDRRELLERVGLSAHVIRLLEEACRRPGFLGEGGAVQ